MRTVPPGAESLDPTERDIFANIAVKNAAKNSVVHGTPLQAMLLNGPEGTVSQLQTMATELLDNFLDNCNNSKRPVYLTNSTGNKHVMLVNPMQAHQLLRYDKVFSLVRVPDRGLQLVPNPNPDPENQNNEYTVVPIEHFVRNASHKINIPSTITQQQLKVGLDHLLEPFGSYIIDSVISALLSTVEEFCDNNFNNIPANESRPQQSSQQQPPPPEPPMRVFGVDEFPLQFENVSVLLSEP